MKGNCGECDLRWACDIDPDKCNVWPDPVPMTNADRIRAMSDEEFAEWITAGENCVMTICDHICGGECNAIATFRKSGAEACKEIVMKWLRQPAEDDHDERKENENV